ncbi:hypothetical protein BH11PSE11_BH11PSE11_08390 [soil metagenome]
MTDLKLTLNRDEALGLAEFFARYEETGRLVFKHPAEYLSLVKLSAQIDKSVPEFFDPNYKQILEKAKERVAAGFEGKVPGMEE